MQAEKTLENCVSNKGFAFRKNILKTQLNNRRITTRNKKTQLLNKRMICTCISSDIRIANHPMKMCLTSLTFGKMQIKTTR